MLIRENCEGNFRIPVIEFYADGIASNQLVINNVSIDYYLFMIMF